MASNPNARKFPTLTEVVYPASVPQGVLEPGAATAPSVLAAAPRAEYSSSEAPTVPTTPPGLEPPSQAQVEQVIQRLGPALDLELRRSAHALLDVQLNSILPDLHQRIAHLVRQALSEKPGS